MAEDNTTLYKKIEDLFDGDVIDLVETIMTEHYVAKRGTRAGKMVHSECQICEWLERKFQLTEFAFVNGPADEAYARLLERCLHEPTEDHITLRVKQSWLDLYEFIRKIAREGIFEDLNGLSRNHVMPHGLLSLLRQVENQLQQSAVRVMLVSEGANHDEL